MLIKIRYPNTVTVKISFVQTSIINELENGLKFLTYQGEW